MIESGEVWIIRNKITTNQEGIVLTNSIPLIQDNQIVQNRGNGIMCIKYSKPKILSNQVQDNDGIGLYLRDNFKGQVIDNKVNTPLKRSSAMRLIWWSRSSTGNCRIYSIITMSMETAGYPLITNAECFD